jgi:hypothetical protein
MLSTNAASAIKGHATANNSMEKDTKPKTADLTMGEEPTAAGDFPLRSSVSPMNSMIDDKGSITKMFSGGSQSGFDNANTNRPNYTGRGLILNSPTFSNGNECGEQSIEDEDLKTSPRLHHLKQVKT